MDLLLALLLALLILFIFPAYGVLKILFIVAAVALALVLLRRLR